MSSKSTVHNGKGRRVSKQEASHAVDPPDIPRMDVRPLGFAIVY